MLQILGLILPAIMPILQKIIPDPVQLAKAQQDITLALINQDADVMKAARDVIVAETQSDSILARSWRPVLMYLLMAMLVWITAVAPIFGLVEPTVQALAGVPSNLWTLLTIGMGGYIVARSGEKIATTLMGNKNG